MGSTMYRHMLYWTHLSRAVREFSTLPATNFSPPLFGLLGDGDCSPLCLEQGVLWFGFWYALVLSCPFACFIRWESSHHPFCVLFSSSIHPLFYGTCKGGSVSIYVYLQRTYWLITISSFGSFPIRTILIQPCTVEYINSSSYTLYPHRLCLSVPLHLHPIAPCSLRALAF
ncbi:hypothetical protein B0H14DRAFT_1500034 [Mycena olivaceomarginata]|nr:hypothetical protein B0H14DRAFT_1500034 [Mycena olivaceomarginata]